MRESHDRTHPHGPGHNHHHAPDHEHVEEAAVPRPDTATRWIFRIEGMHCAEEIGVLKREIGPVVGGEDRLAFNLLGGRMMVSAETEAVSVETIRQAVARTGMRAEEWRAGDGQAQQAEIRKRRLHAGLTAASGAFVFAGLALHAWLGGGIAGAFDLHGEGAAHHVPEPAIAAYLAAIVLGGRYVVVKAWYAARRLRPDMNLLMTVAVAGAMAIGEWFEAATVAFLFALSLALEGWSIGRARRAVEALLDLAPPIARMRLGSGEEREVPVAEVPIGATIIVKPGERIPLDGAVAVGAGTVNQAPITGESLPVLKEPDSEVFAGTINGEAALEITTAKAATDSILAQITRLVESAQSRRARAEQWVDRFATIYTPVVITLAVAVALVPPLVGIGLWEVWFYRALVLLVIACPCALVISTPVSVIAGLAASARSGVLVKGGIYLETPARLKAIAFDKTGTLTEGRAAVVEVHPLNGHTEDEVLLRGAALEARSTHPLARAIVEYAQRNGIAATAAKDAQILPGQGVSGTFEGRPFWLGSHRFLEERGQETDDVHRRAEALERAGHTVVAIGNESHVCGLIALADEVRPESTAVIRTLRQIGIEHLVMLTGDNQAPAEAIARQTGIDEVHAELLPADKMAVVESLVARYGSVAMVGDGVNDAPAMGLASMGIAMGAIGSDVAIETADVALMTDDLSRIPWLVRHSRRTLGVIRQNIAFALLVKAIFFVLTFIGLASLWGAIVADVVAALLVTANGLRLLRPKDQHAITDALL